MPVSKAQQKAVHKYNSTNYDRLELIVRKGEKEAIKAHAERMGESVNSFVSRAVKTQIRIDSETITDPNETQE